jgi:Ulp1 family protease
LNICTDTSASQLGVFLNSTSPVTLGASKISLRPVDIQRLRPTKWLNDEIINAYQELLQKKAIEDSTKLTPLVVIMSSFFMKKLAGGYSQVARWFSNGDRKVGSP